MAGSKFTAVAALLCTLNLASAYPAQAAEQVDYCVPVQPPCQQCQPVPPPPCQECQAEPAAPGIEVDVSPKHRRPHHRPDPDHRPRPPKDVCKDNPILEQLEQLPPERLGFCSEIQPAFAIPAIPQTPIVSPSIVAAADAARSTQTVIGPAFVQVTTTTTTTTTTSVSTTTSVAVVEEFPFSVFDVERRETEKQGEDGAIGIPDDVIADAIAEQVGKLDPESFLKEASIPKGIKAAFNPKEFDPQELAVACACYFAGMPPPMSTTTVSVASSEVLAAAVAPEIVSIPGPRITDTITQTATLTSSSTTTTTTTSTSTLTELTLR